MNIYQDLIIEILGKGKSLVDKGGDESYFITNFNLKLDLAKGWPILSPVNPKAIIAELIWFLGGSIDSLDLWKEFSESINIDYLYGRCWRSWPFTKSSFLEELNEIKCRIQNEDFPSMSPLKKIGFLGVITLNDFERIGLPERTVFLKFHLSNGELHCIIEKDESDIIADFPCNLAAYSLLVLLLAKVSGVSPGKITWKSNRYTFQKSNLPQVQLALMNQPSYEVHLELSENLTLDKIKFNDFKITK